MSLRAHPVTISESADRLAILDAVFQNTPDIVVILTHDGRLLDASHSALAFANISMAEATGQTLWLTPGFASRVDLARWLEAAVRAGAPLGATPQASSDWMNAAGELRVLQFAIRALIGPGGKQQLLQLVGLDITERALLERSAAERKRRLRMITDNMHDLLFLLRLESAEVMRVESVNLAYLRTTGRLSEDVIGKRLEEVVNPSQLADVRAHIARAIAADGPISYTSSGDVPKGRLVVETTLTALRDDDNRATHVLGLSRDVTEQVKASEALRDSEARFRAALDAGQDAFVIASAVRDASGTLTDFVVVDANARASTLVDQSLTALIGRSLLDAFPLSRDSALWEQCCRVVASRVPMELTQSAPIPEMPDRHVLRQIVPLGDGVAISSRDVTERQRQQRLLELSETRHRQLFESNSAMQLIVDARTGAVIDVNPAAERFYGWPRETMRAMHIGDIDVGSPHIWLIDADPASTPTHTTPVVRDHRTSTGVLRHVEVAMSAVMIAGVSVHHVILNDVTDRLRAENHLRESEARFRAVVSSMSEGVVVHDHLGVIRTINPSAERILGLSADELLGVTPISRDWRAVREDGSDWPAAQHPAMVALSTGETQPRTLMGIRRGDDEHAWLQVSAAPLIRDGEQQPYGAVAVFADVTTQRGAEERLREAQKLEAIGQLAGGIAHDFNNLLTVIRGASGFLLDSLPSHAPQVEDVKSIERAAERAEALTRRLLAIGRRQMLRTESVDLGALVQEQFTMIRNDMPRTIRVQLALSDQQVLARLDKRQVHDALRALVDNARRAMPDGGTLTLATSHRTVERPIVGSLPRDVRDRSVEAQTIQKHYAVLEVSDTGEGMSEEVRARLFEPFFSTQPFGTSRGMGLASVHGMVAQSQGFIECDSMPGKGTSLRLYFPSAVISDRMETPAVSTPAIGPRTIMIVDDDPMLRELGRRMLEKLGYGVVVAGSGQDALTQLAAQPSLVSAIVTDLTMPGMSGMELISELERRYPQLPTVAMSGFAMNPSVRQELDARRIPFVGKPFVATDLSRAVERAHAQRSAVLE